VSIPWIREGKETRLKGLSKPKENSDIKGDKKKRSTAKFQFRLRLFLSDLKWGKILFNEVKWRDRGLEEGERVVDGDGKRSQGQKTREPLAAFKLWGTMKSINICKNQVGKDKSNMRDS